MGFLFDLYLIGVRRRRLRSAEFKQLMELVQCNHIMVTVSCPRVNGQIERINRFLTPILSKMIGPENEWDRVLKMWNML